jgi:hypothetical protein
MNCSVLFAFHFRVCEEIAKQQTSLLDVIEARGRLQGLREESILDQHLRYVPERGVLLL